MIFKANGNGRRPEPFFPSALILLGWLNSDDFFQLEKIFNFFFCCFLLSPQLDLPPMLFDVSLSSLEKLHPMSCCAAATGGAAEDDAILTLCIRSDENLNPTPINKLKQRGESAHEASCIASLRKAVWRASTLMPKAIRMARAKGESRRHATCCAVPAPPPPSMTSPGVLLATLPSNNKGVRSLSPTTSLSFSMLFIG